MSAARFTPGPWRVEKHRCKISVVNPAAVHTGSHGGGGKLIASTPCPLNSPQAPKALANAHLIAAAPELYEALVFAHTFIPEDYAQQFADAEALLAKARGEFA